jgi:hypothetical protein
MKLAATAKKLKLSSRKRTGLENGSKVRKAAIASQSFEYRNVAGEIERKTNDHLPTSIRGVLLLHVLV